MHKIFKLWQTPHSFNADTKKSSISTCNRFRYSWLFFISFVWIFSSQPVSLQHSFSLQVTVAITRVESDNNFCSNFAKFLNPMLHFVVTMHCEC